MYTELSDRALVDRILAGDKGCSEAFCDRFFGFLCAVIARRWSRFPHMVSEIPQDVFVRVFSNDCRALREWHGDEDIAPYLAAIARNLANDYRRTKPPGVFQDPVTGGLSPTEPVDPNPGPEELARIEERRGQIAAAMQRLAPRDRELIERRFMREDDYDTIGRDLEMNVNAVYVAVHRAVSRLGDLVREADAPPEGPR